jgi:hypothetical protein
MATVLNAIVLKCLNYITITMLTPTPQSLLFLKKLYIYIYIYGQTDPVLLTTIDFFLPLL